MLKRLSSSAAILCSPLTAPAIAHEFWIQPDAYSIEPGAVLRLTLMHGERFNGAPVPRNNGYIARFESVGADSSTQVQGLDGNTTSFMRAADEGDQVLVYYSNEYTSLLDADRFNAYLEEEGLDAIIQMRESSGESDEPGREVYSRCAKSLIDADGDGLPADRALGLPYEILLLPDSFDGTIRAQLLDRGEPLEGAVVVAVLQDDPSALTEHVTDENGRVEFPNTRPGVWMLTSIHMSRLPDRHDADWESHWASLTLQIPDRGSSTATTSTH